jgi:hypothetical protein
LAGVWRVFEVPLEPLGGMEVVARGLGVVVGGVVEVGEVTEVGGVTEGNIEVGEDIEVGGVTEGDTEVGGDTQVGEDTEVGGDTQVGAVTEVVGAGDLDVDGVAPGGGTATCWRLTARMATTPTSTPTVIAKTTTGTSSRLAPHHGRPVVPRRRRSGSIPLLGSRRFLLKGA